LILYLSNLRYRMCLPDISGSEPPLDLWSNYFWSWQASRDIRTQQPRFSSVLVDQQDGKRVADRPEKNCLRQFDQGSEIHSPTLSGLDFVMDLARKSFLSAVERQWLMHDGWPVELACLLRFSHLCWDLGVMNGWLDS